jgi:hypothetical protein
MKTRPITTTLLIQHQASAWRLGAGPSVVFGRWSTREDERQVVLTDFRGATQRYLHSDWQTISIKNPTTTNALAPAVGLAAQASAFVPFSRWVLGEVYLRGAGYTNTTLPSSPNFKSASVTNATLQAGISLGIGWR